jgi:hypothetical protein
MNALDQSIRMMDKRFNDDVNIIYQHREKMKERIGECEAELDKFKVEFEARQQDNRQLLEDVMAVKEKVREEMGERLEEVYRENE